VCVECNEQEYIGKAEKEEVVVCVCVSSTRLDKVTDCQLLVLYELSKARSRALLHIISSRLGAGQSGA
jgi:hypothetical protein